jgi:hypothetical protein
MVTSGVTNSEFLKLICAVGANAGEPRAEAAPAIAMGDAAANMGLTVHPRQTLSEAHTIAAEAFVGTLTDR